MNGKGFVGVDRAPRGLWLGEPEGILIGRRRGLVKGHAGLCIAHGGENAILATERLK